MKRNLYRPYIAAGITALCVIAAAILLFFLVYKLPAVGHFLGKLCFILRPVFYGMILAFLLLPIQRALYHFFLPALDYRRKNAEKTAKFCIFLSTILSLVIAILIVYILLALALPQVFDSIRGLIDASPGYVDSVQRWLSHFFENNPDIQAVVLRGYDAVTQSVQDWFEKDVSPNLSNFADTVAWIQTTILPNIGGMVSSVSAMATRVLYLIKDLIIAAIISVYLLMRKDKFAAQSKKLVYSALPTRWADFLVEETRGAYKILSGFISGKLLDSLIIGIIMFFGATILRFPYPALVATIIGVTNIIPFFGPFIGAIPCGLIILLVSPLKCLYFVIFILALQQFDGNILGPKILGESTGLDSFWVLFSILLFGGFFGVIGMLLGVPVFAVLYNLLSRLVRFGLRKRRLPEQTSRYVGRTMAMVDQAGKEDPKQP